MLDTSEIRCLTKGEKNAGRGNAQREPREIPWERGGCANQKTGITPSEQSLKNNLNST